MSGQGSFVPTEDFYPRPPRGGRHARIPFMVSMAAISIHALREEGDSLPPAHVDEPVRFLSTPSARRATILPAVQLADDAISIHALREEGDKISGYDTNPEENFYPRPPRGGRRLHRHSQADVVNFYPRPPRGGRRPPVQSMDAPCIFLSTPSARRATAKTETKSLFSNKLYNILHEFRRALIYNGSKNYPNHAKRLENPVRRCRKDAEDSPFAPGRKTQNNSRPSCSKGG